MRAVLLLTSAYFDRKAAIQCGQYHLLQDVESLKDVDGSHALSLVVMHQTTQTCGREQEVL